MTAILFGRVALSVRFELDGWWIEDENGQHKVVLGIVESRGLYDEESGAVGRSIWFVAWLLMFAVTWRAGGKS